jgi:hypothetical protein
MNTVFKFENADQCIAFSRLVGSVSFDLERCIVKVFCATMCDHSAALWAYEQVTCWEGEI